MIGDWEKLPLRTLEDALLERRVCDRELVKVLDKASVSYEHFFLNTIYVRVMELKKF